MSMRVMTVWTSHLKRFAVPSEDKGFGFVLRVASHIGLRAAIASKRSSGIGRGAWSVLELLDLTALLVPVVVAVQESNCGGGIRIISSHISHSTAKLSLAFSARRLRSLMHAQLHLYSKEIELAASDSFQGGQ